jgi:hypothetical protein
MIAKTLARTGAIAAAFVVLTAASRDSVPQYYTHAEYYSDSNYTTQVGGWLSCPPAEGGYHSWGTRTAYDVITTDDYDACSLAE